MKKGIVVLIFIVIFISGCTNQETPKTGNGDTVQGGSKIVSTENFQIKSLNVVRIPLGETMRVIGDTEIQGSAKKISCVLKYGTDLIPGEVTKEINLDSGGKTSITMHAETTGKIDTNKWTMCCTPGDRFARDSPKTKCGS